MHILPALSQNWQRLFQSQCIPPESYPGHIPGISLEPWQVYEAWLLLKWNGSVSWLSEVYFKKLGILY